MHYFKLAFFVGSSGESISMEDYILQRKKGVILWLPDLENVTIQLVVENKEYIARHWSLGALRYLLPQFPAAISLLSRHKEALIRAGVNDTLKGTYFLMEPDGENNVLLSMFYIEDTAYSHSYPVPAGSDQAGRLYDYVISNKETLVFKTGNEQDVFKKLSFPLQQLKAEMQEQVELASALHQLMPDVDTGMNYN